MQETDSIDERPLEEASEAFRAFERLLEPSDRVRADSTPSRIDQLKALVNFTASDRGNKRKACEMIAARGSVLGDYPPFQQHPQSSCQCEVFLILLNNCLSAAEGESLLSTSLLDLLSPVLKSFSSSSLQCDCEYLWLVPILLTKHKPESYTEDK